MFALARAGVWLVGMRFVFHAEPTSVQMSYSAPAFVGSARKVGQTMAICMQVLFSLCAGTFGIGLGT